MKNIDIIVDQFFLDRIQELVDKNVNLENRLALLEAKLVSLEAKVEGHVNHHPYTEPPIYGGRNSIPPNIWNH